MGRRRRGEIPRLRLHRASGRAVVTIEGVTHYVGPWGDPASERAYRSLVARWFEGAPSGRRPVQVRELTAAWRAWYQPHVGSASRYLAEGVARELDRLAGLEPVDSIRPRLLLDLAEALVSRGLRRATVNAYLSLAKRVFRWGVERDLVPGSTWTALQAVSPLQRGRTRAPELDRVDPVEWERVAPVIEILGEPYASILSLCWHTGARVGEICSVSWDRIDHSGNPWVYRPTRHKTELRGHTRAIGLGARSQEILERFRDREPIFATRFGDPVKSRNVYDRVRDACRRLGIEAWHPHQIRHSHAARVRAAFGLETARAALGHSGAALTELYAGRDLALALRVAEVLG